MSELWERIPYRSEVMNLGTIETLELLSELRRRDCAVVCFVADELRGADPDQVEDRLIELGWGVIDSLATDVSEDEEDDE
jgi:hypothetical protein